jgi:hypothetical protein
MLVQSHGDDASTPQTDAKTSSSRIQAEKPPTSVEVGVQPGEVAKNKRLIDSDLSQLNNKLTHFCDGIRHQLSVIKSDFENAEIKRIHKTKKASSTTAKPTTAFPQISESKANKEAIQPILRGVTVSQTVRGETQGPNPVDQNRSQPGSKTTESEIDHVMTALKSKLTQQMTDHLSNSQTNHS